MNKKQIIIIGSLILIVVIFLLLILEHSYNSSHVNSSSTGATPTSTASATSLSYEYHINLPDTLILVDSQGRRTGKDPATGIIYREIPSSSYGEDGSGELIFSESLGSQYTVYVLGGQTGTYNLDAWITNLGYQTPPQRIFGTIQAGSMIAYVPSYNLTNLASSTLSLESTSSTTASITSAPPKNLPPPPIL